MLENIIVNKVLVNIINPDFFVKFSNFSDSSEKSDETQKSSVSIRTRTLPKVQNKFHCLSVLICAASTVGLITILNQDLDGKWHFYGGRNRGELSP